jgi:hypothetical protein
MNKDQLLLLAVYGNEAEEQPVKYGCWLSKVVDNIANATDDDIVKIDFPVTMVYYEYIWRFK